MSSSITWTDGTGAGTLTNGKPVPADRFSGWTPDIPLVTADVTALASGQPYPFVFRTDNTATFTLDKIPNTNQPLALRLIAWLRGGGVVTVNTGDLAARSYASCYLAMGSVPRLVLSDPKNLEYSLALTLLSTAGAPLLCIY